MARKGPPKRTKLDLEFDRTRRRYDLAKWTLAPAIWLLSSWVPLHVAERFSGHKTTVTVSVGITIGVSIAGLVSLVTVYMRAKRAESENDRLRLDVTRLEGELKGVLARP